MSRKVWGLTSRFSSTAVMKAARSVTVVRKHPAARRLLMSAIRARRSLPPLRA